MTAYFGEYGFVPEKLDIFATDTVDYWEHVVDYWHHIVRQAVVFFEYKEDFAAWVYRNYASDHHRMAAMFCWDWLDLAEADDEDLD